MTHAIAARGSVAVLAALLLLPACADGPMTKAGAGAVPVTLRLASVEQRSNTPYVPEILAFVDAVEVLSDGAVTIDVVWQKSGWVPDAETRVAQSVRDGEIELALVPARAFSELGIHRLNALQTPFLVDSPEVSSAVVASPVAAAMLSDLGSEGFVGLAMMHESMRRPVGYDAPVLTANDYQGIGIRTPESVIADRLFRELGARPEVSELYLFDESGDPLAAAESAYAWTASLPRQSIATADVVFYPKVNVLVASPDHWRALTASQQDLLRRAAELARSHAEAGMADEVEAAGRFCLEGGRLAYAGSAARSELLRRAEPVRAWLASDATIAADIRAIELISRQTSAGEFREPWQCGPRSGDWAPWPEPKASPETSP